MESMRGGERPSLLPHHLWGRPSGQPPQRLWGLGDPLPSPLRKCNLVHSTKHSPQYLQLDMNLSHKLLILLSPWHLDPVPHQNGDTPPQLDCIPSSLRSHPRVAPEEPPHSKRRDEMPLHKALAGGQWKVGFRASVEGKRGTLQEKLLPFWLQNLPWPENVFWNMITSAGLLGSKIYEIQESWEGQSELQYANDALTALPKGLQFFHAVSPSELPKVMGLAGIHNPDALCCFNSMTFCPWCGKEGQNEGTIVNLLWMTYYKLGLVCGTCFHCPSVTSEAIQCHGWKSFQHPWGEHRGLDDTSSSA